MIQDMLICCIFHTHVFTSCYDRYHLGAVAPCQVGVESHTMCSQAVMTNVSSVLLPLAKWVWNQILSHTCIV